MPRRPHPGRPLVGGIAAALLLLAGCGDDGDAAAPDPGAQALTDDVEDAADDDAAGEGDDAAPSGACGLLPESEVASAFGEPTDVVHDEGTGASLEMCEWTFPADDDALGVPPTLQLVVLGPDDFDARTQGGDGLFQEIAGLGDEARWAYAGSEQTGYLAQLLVRKGDRGIHLNAAGLDLASEDEARETFTSLAGSALSGS